MWLEGWLHSVEIRPLICAVGGSVTWGRFVTLSPSTLLNPVGELIPSILLFTPVIINS